MIQLEAQRRSATAQEAEAALAALDTAPGLYFGVDGGIPGLHPLQATLVVQPALALRLFGDGVEVQARSAFGRALLAQPALAAWAAGCTRGRCADVLGLLRAFLACFAPSVDTVLLGALPFAAHRLAAAQREPIPLGVVVVGEELLRRDGNGSWTAIRLHLPGAELELEREASPLAPSPAQDSAPPRQEVDDDHPPGGYAGMVRRGLPWLREKPLLSLTLSQSYRRAVRVSPAQAFSRLMHANPAPACFFLNDGGGLRLLGASPDLQLRIHAGEVQAMPVCGTVARRPGAQGEAESLRELMNEQVDAASLAVCSDMLRNDLAPLCEPGSLRLLDRRRPMSLSTVVHAVDRLAGTLRAGQDAWSAIAATAAPVMVTGAPRALALQAIDALEASPRGWYGGLVVQVASNGDALVGTILRAAAVVHGVAEVRTGGDLMADSDPQREEQESRLKSRSLWRAFGLEDAPATQAAGEQAALSTLPSVRLEREGDPLGASLEDCLAGLGFRLAVDAPVTVYSGAGTSKPAPVRHCVAIGDAAYRLLRQEGAAVESVAAEHGRAVTCTPAAEGHPGFTVGRYAVHRLAGAPPPGWEATAHDEQGAPLVLLNRERQVSCVLFRPESVLSDLRAVQLLRDAIVAAAPG